MRLYRYEGRVVVRTLCMSDGCMPNGSMFDKKMHVCQALHVFTVLDDITCMPA